MFTHLQVEHFKSLADVHITLGNVTVFVGRNSVGKSNVIEALIFLRDCLDRGIDSATSDRFGIDSILQWSRFRPYKLLIRIDFRDGPYVGHYSLRISSRKKQPVILSESGSWRARDNKESVSFEREGQDVRTFGFPQDIQKLISAQGIDDDETVISRLRYIAGHTSGINRLYRTITSTQSYSIYPNVVRDPQKPSREPMLTHSGDNITSILKSMVSSKSARVRRSYSEILSTMKMIIPNLERILVRNLSGFLWLNFEVSESDGKSHQLNTTQISDGALRILGILVAIYQPNPPRLIAIEEPEQNLHPGALGLLADAFRDRSEGAQLILTTHSPHLIDHFDANDIRTVETRDGVSQIGRISEYHRKTIKDGLMSAGELMLTQGLIREG